MTCEELSIEYEERAEAISRRFEATRERANRSHGEEQYRLRRELKILESMARDCRYTARQLKGYRKGGTVDENGLHRQKSVGVHNAMPYTLKCFVLRSSTSNGLED